MSDLQSTQALGDVMGWVKGKQTQDSCSALFTLTGPTWWALFQTVFTDSRCPSMFTIQYWNHFQLTGEQFKWCDKYLVVVGPPDLIFNVASEIRGNTETMEMLWPHQLDHKVLTRILFAGSGHVDGSKMTAGPSIVLIPYECWSRQWLGIRQVYVVTNRWRFYLFSFHFPLFSFRQCISLQHVFPLDRHDKG